MVCLHEWEIKMKQQINIRKLKPAEPIPYDLLLIADETKEAIDKYIHDCEIYVAELGEEKIAVYAIYTVSKKDLEIKNIAVIPHLQGRGIGKRLLSDAEERAKAAGYRYLLIATADGGIRQIQLYQQYGFEMHEIRKDFFAVNYPEPIYENGIQLKHMIVLRKKII